MHWAGWNGNSVLLRISGMDLCSASAWNSTGIYCLGITAWVRSFRYRWIRGWRTPPQPSGQAYQPLSQIFAPIQFCNGAGGGFQTIGDVLHIGQFLGLHSPLHLPALHRNNVV